MKGLKYTLTILVLLVSASVFAQSKKQKKADELYKLNEYSAAIPAYEQLLRKKSNLSNKTKLAFCYKVINKTKEAEKLYEEIVQEERAKDITYLYYGETLMSNEKYDEAREWFNKYSERRPDDERGRLLAISCAEVKNIQPVFPNMRVKSFTQNSDTDDSAPVIFNDGIVFSSDRPQGIKLLKQKSGTTGRDFVKLYFSAGNLDDTFEPAKPYSSKINELNKNTGPISFTADGTTAVFTRNSKVANKKNTYPMQLFSAESSDGKKWKNVKEIDFCRLTYNYMHPAISPDGKQLFFVSDKAQGVGGTDIYVSQRQEDGEWGKPRNLGTIINTSMNEGFPFVDHKGRLYFSSKGHPGYGGFDLFYTEKDADGNWIKPVNIGRPINSPLDDISIFVRKEGDKGMFTSSRDGGDDDIFFFLPKDMEDEEEDHQLLTFEDATEEPVVTEEPPLIDATEEQMPVSSQPQDEASNEATEEVAIQPMKNATLETAAEEVKSDAAAAPTYSIPTESEEEPISEEVAETVTEVPAVDASIDDPIPSEAPLDSAVEEPPVEAENIVEAPSTDDGQLPPSNPTEEPMPTEEEYSAEFPDNGSETEESNFIASEENPTETVEAAPPAPEAEMLEEEEDLIEWEEAPEEVIPPAPDDLETAAPIEETAPEPTDGSLQIPEEVLVEPSATEEPLVTEEEYQSDIPSSLPPSLQANDPTTAPADKEDLYESKGIVESSAPNPEPTFIENPSPAYESRSSASYSSFRSYDDLDLALANSDVTAGQTFELPDIKYTFNEFAYEVTPDIRAQLDRLLGVLQDHPTLRIEIGGYTSSFGEDTVNKTLSRYRAESAVAYLVTNGIDQDRLTARGYGETKLLNDCRNGVLCTRTQHMENQRLEIKILVF
ncbi:MAG: OmpA family protein [Bacteroidota bacterium]